MRTILWGNPTAEQLADAALFSGIEVTEQVTEKTIPVDPMVGGEAGVRQQHWRMALNADALICVGENEHLVRAAESLKLLVYQA